MKIGFWADLMLICIGKDIPTGRVAMQIEDIVNFLGFPNAIDKIVNSLYFREHLQIFRIEIAIKVLADSTSSMISDEYSIRVYHWNNIEVEFLQEIRQFKDSFHKIFQSKIWDSLSWMCSS